jgi:hypothetical protein
MSINVDDLFDVLLLIKIFHCPDDTNDRTSSGMEQHLQRAVLEENRNRLLQMGYTDSYFMKAIIHLKTLGKLILFHYFYTIICSFFINVYCYVLMLNTWLLLQVRY